MMMVAITATVAILGTPATTVRSVGGSAAAQPQGAVPGLVGGRTVQLCMYGETAEWSPSYSLWELLSLFSLAWKQSHLSSNYPLADGVIICRLETWVGVV